LNTVPIVRIVLIVLIVHIVPIALVVPILLTCDSPAAFLVFPADFLGGMMRRDDGSGRVFGEVK
jgi:hypothetical protein